MIRTTWCPNRRSGTHRSGQALVEFVLVVPILLLLIFGLVDFARAWQTHHAIADAAREGARILVVDNHVGPDSAKAVIQKRLSDARLDVSSDKLDIDFIPAIGHPGRNNPLTVTIDYEYDFWILGPFMKWATGDRHVNLVSTITMRGE